MKEDMVEGVIQQVVKVLLESPFMILFAGA
jgi:hypothetical protein